VLEGLREPGGSRRAAANRSSNSARLLAAVSENEQTGAEAAVQLHDDVEYQASEAISKHHSNDV